MAGVQEQEKGKIKLWVQVIIGLFLGVGFGFFMRSIGQAEYLDYIKHIGTIFIDLIKMVVVPLVFFSLIAGITSMSDNKTFNRVGTKAVIMFMATVAFAIVIGLVCANIFKPGEGANLELTNGHQAVTQAKEVKSVGDILLNIVPTNGIGAMAEGNILQVVFFAVFVGITLNLMGDKARKVIDLSYDCAQVVFKMIGIIIKISPYAVFALMAWVVGKQGLDIIVKLGKLVVTVIIACGLQYIVFGVLIFLFARLNPMPFYRKSLEYQSLAFSTSSSKATLATTMYVAEHKMGISKSTTSFVLPLGAAINMDGTAIYLGICAVFLAQATGVELQMHDYMIIVLTSTIASIGAAGYPGGALVMMSLVLHSVNLPIEGIAIIAGIDRILDMLRTTINITGDTTITLIVDKSEGKLDEKQYYS